MNIKNTMLGMLAATSLTLALGAGASATPTLSAIADSAGNTSNSNVTYISGASGTGGITVTNGNLASNDAFLHSKVGLGTDSSVSIQFGPLTNGSSYTYDGTHFDQSLNGSTFTITSNDKAGNPVLLSGTFGAADLTGTVGSGGAGVSLKASSVTYTGGTFFPAGYSPNNGSLALEFTSVVDTGTGNTGPIADATSVHSFTANDAITYSAITATVPEPGTVTSFVLGGLGVLGLMIRARKSAVRTA